MKVFFDFETRSTCELKTAGAHKYAKDPTTDVICIAWAIDDGPIKIYRHLDGDEPPQELFDAIAAGGEFVAHNAQFERLIWYHVCHKRYGWPAIPVEQLHCTMVMAYAMGLMGTLEAAGHCVGLQVQKDMKGNRVMLQLAKPRSVDKETGEVTWWERADSKPKLDINEKYETVYKYCMTDIDVTRELFKRLPPLDEVERNVWFLDQQINDRGVHIDERSVRNAIRLAEYEGKNLHSRMRECTDNQVASCNAHAALRKWVNDQGVETDSVDKASVFDMLQLDDLPEHVKEVLEIRQSAAKSSVNKLNRMISSAHNGRSGGMFQYWGAASTGRWAGRLIQLQNLPRPSMKQLYIEQVLEKMGDMDV